MPQIELKTTIKSPIRKVFNAARSVDLHLASALPTQEKAIAGRTTGMLKLEERTRWRAKHFGIWLELEVAITEMREPELFVDEMVDGNFKYMRHTHQFERVANDHTLMTDIFDFESPYGLVGRMVDRWILKEYLTNFLRTRNQFLKEYLEQGDL